MKERSQIVKPIEIFWSPAAFSTDQEQWNILYADPQPVFSIFSQEKNPGILKCPATRQTSKNLFRFNSNFADKHIFEPGFLETINQQQTNNYFASKGLIALRKERESSLAGYIDIMYNLSWLFWSPEPLLARFSAPYFPAISPTKNALLATGQFDIGKWYRPWRLDYHIPLNAKSFIIEKNDPLFFLEFFTDRKIIFRRYLLTPELLNLSDEMASQSGRFPKISILDRYEMAKKSRLMEIVGKHIKEAAI